LVLAEVAVDFAGAACFADAFLAEDGDVPPPLETVAADRVGLDFTFALFDEWALEGMFLVLAIGVVSLLATGYPRQHALPGQACNR
jgi:hypothetical protein